MRDALARGTAQVAPPKAPAPFRAKEVIAEAPAALAPRRYRSWKGKTDAEVLAIADETIRDGGITGRDMLWKADAGLASVLRKRGLLGKVSYCGAPKTGRRRAGGNGSAAEAHEAGAPGSGAAGLAASPESGMGESEGHAGDCGAAPGVSWERADIIFLAQSAIDELRIADHEELGRLDPELRALVDELGAGAELKYHSDYGGNTEAEASAGSNGRPRSLEGMSAEQLRKADLRGMPISDGAAYRLIFAECFRLGTANPYMGSLRATVQKLQSGMNRRLNGPQHRVFRKCWDRMVAEGVISHNSNCTAASIEPRPEGVRDRGLRSAISWALSEQAAVSPEWRARIGGPLTS